MTNPGATASSRPGRAPAGRTSIGLLNEKALHAGLKRWYARPGDRLEVAVGGFVVDIVRDDLLIEIQTRGFSAMKAKLTELLERHRVRLVHPIAVEKWIVRLPRAGGIAGARRRSPKVGRLLDLFGEAVHLAGLLRHPNLSLEVVLTREEEVRRYVGRRAWRRQGWTVEERRLLGVVESRLFPPADDFRCLLPEGLGAFTTRDLARATRTSEDLARQMIYCLRHTGALERAGMRGRAPLHRVARA